MIERASLRGTRLGKPQWHEMNHQGTTTALAMESHQTEFQLRDVFGQVVGL